MSSFTAMSIERFHYKIGVGGVSVQFHKNKHFPKRLNLNILALKGHILKSKANIEHEHR